MLRQSCLGTTANIFDRIAQSRALICINIQEAGWLSRGKVLTQSLNASDFRRLDAKSRPGRA